MKFLKLALAATVAFTGPALAADQPKGDPTYGPYETPGLFAKLGNGDTIHIKCMGKGSPTVILTAGAGGWAVDWRKVQPQIAKTTHVCAWDRPGYGFSSGSARPQTVMNTTADLEAALKIAHIAGPYVAVGHSLGGYESLLLKDQEPRSVVGMVLVDPSIPDQHNRFLRAVPNFAAFGDHMLQQNNASMDRCIAGLKSGKSKPGLPDPDGCWTYPPDYPPELTAALDKRDMDPLRFPAAQSLGVNFNADGEQLVDPRRNYGDMPLIVLSAGNVAELAGAPKAVKDEVPAFHAAFIRGHDEIAALSSRGVNRVVPGATHYIQYDKPQAVIDAVNEVVAAARSSRH